MEYYKSTKELSSNELMVFLRQLVIGARGRRLDVEALSRYASGHLPPLELSSPKPEVYGRSGDIVTRRQRLDTNLAILMGIEL
jgi:hypothetical protein